MSFKRKKSEGPRGDEWLTTYADMVTLILTFFVLLYSFSVIDIQKFRAFIGSFQGVGILDTGPAPLTEGDPQQSSTFPEINLEIVEPTASTQTTTSEEVYAKVISTLEEKGLQDQVDVSYDDRGVVLDIKERILFDSGKADIKPRAAPLLDALIEVFRGLPYLISVEGHTDNRPISTIEFPSNWELSTARASRIVRYFVEQKDLSPYSFVAIGYGQYRPVADNRTAQGMALNRRVVLVINAKETGVQAGE